MLSTDKHTVLLAMLFLETNVFALYVVWYSKYTVYG